MLGARLWFWVQRYWTDPRLLCLHTEGCTRDTQLEIKVERQFMKKKRKSVSRVEVELAERKPQNCWDIKRVATYRTFNCTDSRVYHWLFSGILYLYLKILGGKSWPGLFSFILMFPSLVTTLQPLEGA